MSDKQGEELASVPRIGVGGGEDEDEDSEDGVDDEHGEPTEGGDQPTPDTTKEQDRGESQSATAVPRSAVEAAADAEAEAQDRSDTPETEASPKRDAESQGETSDQTTSQTDAGPASSSPSTSSEDKEAETDSDSISSSKQSQQSSHEDADVVQDVVDVESGSSPDDPASEQTIDPENIDESASVGKEEVDANTLSWAEREVDESSISPGGDQHPSQSVEERQEGTPSPAVDDSPEPGSFDVDAAVDEWDREVERVYEPAESQLETLQRIDEFLSEIDEDLPTARKRVRASEHFKLHDKVQRDTRAQGKLGFDYVREDGIAVDGDDYIGLISVEPRDWSTLSQEQRRDIAMQYMNFLMSLNHAIAIPAYPREFDLTRHLELVYETGVRQASRERNPLFDYGRKHYQVWLDSKLDTENIRQRDYYIVFKVNREHIAGGITNSPLMSKLPVIGSLYDIGITYLSSRKTDEEVQEEVCVKEVRKRRRKLVRTVNSTGVDPEPITDRHETMEILYHYYNHVEPKLQEFNHATGIFDISEE